MAREVAGGETDVRAEVDNETAVTQMMHRALVDLIDNDLVEIGQVRPNLTEPGVASVRPLQVQAEEGAGSRAVRLFPKQVTAVANQRGKAEKPRELPQERESPASGRVQSHDTTPHGPKTASTGHASAPIFRVRVRRARKFAA